MANKVDNIYVELFEQLPIPESLEPQNIAAMLNERMALNAAPAPVKTLASEKLTEEIPVTRNITKTSNKHKTSTAYRSVASIAACAALAFGVAGYMGVFDSEVPVAPQQGGGAYASDYEDVHKTFEKYYIDDADKKTLDAAIADIDHSYNENENRGTNAVTDPSNDETDPAGQNNESTQAPENTDVPDNTEPMKTDEPVPVEADPTETIDDLVPLPKNKAEDVSGSVKFGDGFMVARDGNILRLMQTGSGRVDYTDNVFPSYTEGTEKTLLGFYADGSMLTAVYSVVRDQSYIPYDSAADGLLDGLYGRTATGSQTSVEVCVYDVIAGKAVLTNDVLQGGSLVNMNYSGGALYLVTAYSDYRVAPIVGVEDLESYVPSYTVNGTKYYVEASDIMIPDYLATTDYTVISGISTGGSVSVKAVLGYEGRVVLKNGAVYLFGYDSLAGSDVTSVKVFGLTNGEVAYAGYKDIDGIALGGDGISVFGSTIAVTTVADTPEGYVTTVGVYDGLMERVSYVAFPTALTTAKREGANIYLSGSGEKYVVDLSNPEAPDWKLLESTASKTADPADGLVSFDGGYVTLTKSSDGLVLSKISKNERGELRLDYKTTIYTGECRSKAFENNGLLFISGSTVGVPYGYFDGLDYCFKYALYRATAAGFELVGETEVHETDEAFENGYAALNGGYLYIFSDGRVYTATTQDGLNVVDTAEIIASAYSGHSR